MTVWIAIGVLIVISGLLVMWFMQSMLGRIIATALISLSSIIFLYVIWGSTKNGAAVAAELEDKTSKLTNCELDSVRSTATYMRQKESLASQLSNCLNRTERRPVVYMGDQPIPPPVPTRPVVYMEDQPISTPAPTPMAPNVLAQAEQEAEEDQESEEI